MDTNGQGEPRKARKARKGEALRHVARIPRLVPDNAGGDVRAELLTVTDAILARMDILEGYPTLYQRETVKVVLDNDSETVALVYVMNTLPRGAKVIPGGDWRNFGRNP